MTYLLDTNIVVYMVRGLKVRTNPTVRQRDRHRIANRILDRAKRQKAAGHEVALSAVTVAELEFGAWNSGDYQTELDATRRAISTLSLAPIRRGRLRRALWSNPIQARILRQSHRFAGHADRRTCTGFGSDPGHQRHRGIRARDRVEVRRLVGVTPNLHQGRVRQREADGVALVKFFGVVVNEPRQQPEEL